MTQTADIQTIRPDVVLSNTAFMTKISGQIPPGAPVVVMWIREDGLCEIRSNRTNRRDWCWMAAHLTHWAVDPP